jgi:5-(aminomethyl)-3-furanmethanol phosphate kinase
MADPPFPMADAPFPMADPRGQNVGMDVHPHRESAIVDRPSPRPIVVKVGGSLLDWPELPGRLGAYLAERRGEVAALVVGGGRAADLIRDLDRAHGLGEERSHDLALRALELTAHVLAALLPGLAVVSDLPSLGAVRSAGGMPVLAPRAFLEREEREANTPLPHRWAVTSDSIAARVAERLGAAELALLKSASPPPGIDRDGAARLGLVDPYFPEASRPLRRVTFLNLRDPAGPAILD